MSRAATGDVVTVKPSNNVYTVLVVVATLVQVIALIVTLMRYSDVFGKNLLQG